MLDKLFVRSLSTIVSFFLLALLSCQPQEQPDPKQYSVPTDVEPYVQAFRQEMQSHNQTIATDNLIITFGTIQGDEICGQCLLESGKTPRITLNRDAYCWQQASTNERECLVFHELGHCLLGRGHRTERFPNKAYVSLMNPDDSGVYATCRYPLDDVCDKRPRRSYYVDELFDSKTPTPAWAK
jgi:hypothetical protein